MQVIISINDQTDNTSLVSQDMELIKSFFLRARKLLKETSVHFTIYMQSKINVLFEQYYTLLEAVRINVSLN